MAKGLSWQTLTNYWIHSNTTTFWYPTMAQTMNIFNCLFELCWACQDGLASSLIPHFICCASAASSSIRLCKRSKLAYSSKVSKDGQDGRPPMQSSLPAALDLQKWTHCYPFFAMMNLSPKVFVASVACFSKFQGRDRVNCPKLAWLIFLIFVRRKLQESILHNGLATGWAMAVLQLAWMVDDGWWWNHA